MINLELDFTVMRKEKLVICYKGGEKKMKLKFQWYYRHKRIGKMLEIELGEGRWLFDE